MYVCMCVGTYVHIYVCSWMPIAGVHTVIERFGQRNRTLSITSRKL